MKLLGLLLAVALAAAANAHAAAQKPPPVSIRFYGEAGREGGNFSEKANLLANGREVYMGSMPLVTEHEVRSFHVFPSPRNDGTMAAYLRLDDHGTRLLQQHTQANRGSYILVFFNGRHLVDLYIGKAVRDDIAYIPSGLTQTDVEFLEMAFPRYGHEDEKPAGKKKKPASE
jgi:hypothetical protein